MYNILQKAGFYDSSLVLTPHQQEMNKASQALALADPSLLNDRPKLMQLARMKVDEDGYRYKHGKSRSKHIHSDTDTNSSSDTIAKRRRTTETERMQRFHLLMKLNLTS